MSRSIHTTRRDIVEAWRVRCAHRSEFTAERTRLRQELTKKRQIKRQVADERRAGPCPVGVPIEAIPIEIHGADDHVHFPASTDDVRTILSLLPPGTTDGLAAVDLRLGAEVQEEHAAGAEPAPDERDPLVNRRGFELLPGYWGGDVLGKYRSPAAKIELYAYVYTPDVPFTEYVELYLRLLQLETLVHEVGLGAVHASEPGRLEPMPDRKALLFWVCTALLASCGGSQPEPSTVVLPAAVPTPDPPAPESTADAPKSPPPPPSRPPRGADTVGVRPLQSAEATKAEELFSEGKALMAAGAIPQACAKFEASNRIEPAMGTLLNLAACEELAGHVFRACRFFREVVQLAQARGQMERARYATERAARLGCSP